MKESVQIIRIELRCDNFLLREKWKIANGLLESAEENAKSVITGLFSNQWNPDEYFTFIC